MIAHDYFTDLFQKNLSSQDRILHALGTSISDEDNNMLMTSFIIEVFKEDIFSMQADKSPSPDCFNPGFYHRFWDTCGP